MITESGSKGWPQLGSCGMLNNVVSRARTAGSTSRRLGRRAGTRTCRGIARRRCRPSYGAYAPPPSCTRGQTTDLRGLLLRLSLAAGAAHKDAKDGADPRELEVDLARLGPSSRAVDPRPSPAPASTRRAVSRTRPSRPTHGLRRRKSRWRLRRRRPRRRGSSGVLGRRTSALNAQLLRERMSCTRPPPWECLQSHSMFLLAWPLRARILPKSVVMVVSGA